MTCWQTVCWNAPQIHFPTINKILSPQLSATLLLSTFACFASWLEQITIGPLSDATPGLHIILCLLFYISKAQQSIQNVFLLQSQLLSIEANYPRCCTKKSKEKHCAGTARQRKIHHGRISWKEWTPFITQMARYVWERRKEIGRVREMWMDTGRYIGRDVWDVGGGGRVVKRRDNRVKEEGRDEVSISEQSIHHKRGVYFGGLSFSLCPSLCLTVYFLYPAWRLLTGVNFWNAEWFPL